MPNHIPSNSDSVTQAPTGYPKEVGELTHPTAPPELPDEPDAFLTLLPGPVHPPNESAVASAISLTPGTASESDTAGHTQVAQARPKVPRPVLGIAPGTELDTNVTQVPSHAGGGSSAFAGVGVTGFAIAGELGRGGMGVVYKATQVGLNRTVALKMLLAGNYSDPSLRARFLLEAESVAALEHPHIVRVYSFGESDGHPFLAMEFLPGGNLAERLKKNGPFPPRDAAAVLAKLAGAVAHAHSRGVVHRDIKPPNVLLAADGEPRLTDFGLAKVGRADQHLSVTGQVLGTPAYMAPEQAAGKVHEVGTAADVYALGAVLYDLLVGRPPFRGDSVAVTLQMVLTEEPTRPRKLNATIPLDLETICLKCLEKVPGKRYASAADLAEDLNRYLDGRQVQARRAGLVELSVKWVRRSPIRAALAVAAVTCAGLLAAILISEAKNEQERKLAAEREKSKDRLDRRNRFDDLVADANRDAKGASSDDVERWTGVVEKLKSALEIVDKDPEAFAESRKEDDARADLKRAEAARDDASERGTARQKLKQFREQYNDALFFSTQATGLPNDQNRKRVRDAVRDGLALFPLNSEGDGQPNTRGLSDDEGERPLVKRRCYELLLLDAQALASEVGSGFLVRHYGLLLLDAQALATRNRTGELQEAARQRVRDALKLLDRAYQMLGKRTRSELAQRAKCHEKLGELAEAQRLNRLAELIPTDPNLAADHYLVSQALGLLAQLVKPDPNLAADYYLLGLTLNKESQFQEAIKALTAALRVEPEHYGAQYLLAVCFLKLKKPQEAKKELNRCLELRPKFIWPRLLLGMAEMDIARQEKTSYDEAVKQLERVLTDYNQSLKEGVPTDDAPRYVALTNLGVLAYNRRKWADAVRYLEDAVAMKRDQLPAYINLALAHRDRAEDAPWAASPAPLGLAAHAARSFVYRRNALDAAARVMDDAIAQQKDAPRLHHERGLIHVLRGDTEKARSDFALAIALAPKDSRGASTEVDDRLELGQLMHEAGEFSRAIETYRVVLEMDPERVTGEQRALAARRMTEPLIALKRWTDAVSALDVYLELTPLPEGTALTAAQAQRLANALKTRGVLYAQLKNAQAALDSYTRSLGFERDPEVLLLRGWAYLSAGATELAQKDFEEALRLRPEDPSALMARAEARVKQGQLPEALADVEGALRNLPSDTRPQTRLRLRYTAARVLAQYAQRERNPDAAAQAAARAAERIGEALADVPKDERVRFWKDFVLADPALGRIPAVQRLAEKFGLDKP